jgi:hypothetical protein
MAAMKVTIFWDVMPCTLRLVSKASSPEAVVPVYQSTLCNEKGCVGPIYCMCETTCPVLVRFWYFGFKGIVE